MQIQFYITILHFYKSLATVLHGKDESNESVIKPLLFIYIQ